jgi:flagella basal body P-ring formation protein FlgA
MAAAVRGWIGAVVLALAAAWLATAQPAPADGPVVVMLRATTLQADARVVVGDVAVVAGGDAMLRRRIAGLDLADLSEAARSTFRKEEVAIRIQLAGVDAKSFRVEGAAQAEVRWSRPELTEEALVAAARRQLLRQVPWAAEELDIREVGTVEVPALDLGQEDRWSFEPELVGGRLAGRVQVDVGIVVNGRKVATIPVRFDVRLYQTIAVASCRIEPGESITQAHLHIDRRALEGTAASQYPAPEQLIGKKARRPVQPGQVLARTDVDTAVPAADSGGPVLIHIRDGVKIMAKVGHLRVTAQGEALQDGKAGQTIRVRNISSKAVITGRVVDKAVVEIDY